jgi:hypothetical protein
LIQLRTGIRSKLAISASKRRSGQSTARDSSGVMAIRERLFLRKRRERDG